MKIHQLKGYIQNIYLVEYFDKILLLDGCCRADIPMLKTFIKEDLNRPLHDLQTIVVTHMHPDHAGAAHKLRKLTGCEIASANKQTHWYRGINGVLMHWVDILLAYYVAYRTKKPLKNLLYSRKLKPDCLLNDGDSVPSFPDWQVLETPGHTDRDLSIYHAETKQVYVADLTVKVKNKFIPPFPLFLPNKYKDSLAKIKDLNPKWVLLAHGGKVQPNIDDYKHLMSLAPDRPQTIWSEKSAIRRLFQRKAKPEK